MESPGEKLVIKLWDTLADKGIGGLLTPWHEKRVAQARAEIRRNEILTIAQAEKEAEEIRSGKAIYEPDSGLKLLNAPNMEVEQSGRIEPVIDLSVFATRNAELNLSDSLRKEVNVSNAILVAEDTLAQDIQEPSEEQVDDDWLFSWREYAGRISSSELQGLWGRILAGEIKQPGTYSFRALEFLKGLSKAEAELICTVAPFVLSGRIYNNHRSFLDKNGLSFSQLLELQDLGILSGVESGGLTATMGSIRKDNFIMPLTNKNRALIVEHEDSCKSFKLEMYKLTRIGNEILQLASFEVNEQYLVLTGRDIINQGFKVSIADWVQNTSDSGEYSNCVELTTESDDNSNALPVY